MIEPAGDAQATATLRSAAAEAQTRGAPDLAVRYLARALAEAGLGTRTGSDHPRPRPGPAGRPRPGSFEHLREAIELTSETGLREAWSLELVRALAVAGRAAEAVQFATAALAAGIEETAVAVRIESELLAVAWLMPALSAEGVERLQALERTGVPKALEQLVIVHRALRMTAEGAPAADAIALVDRAIDGGVLFEQQSSLPFVALITLVWNDDLDRPLELCNAAVALAQQMGSPHLMVNGGAFSALAGVRAGLLAEAASAAALSYEFARGSAMPESIDWAWALAILLDSMRERGEIEAAQELLAAAEAEGDLPGHVTFVFLLESRGRLRCAQGRLRRGRRGPTGERAALGAVRPRSTPTSRPGDPRRRWRCCDSASARTPPGWPTRSWSWRGPPAPPAASAWPPAPPGSCIRTSNCWSRRWTCCRGRRRGSSTPRHCANWAPPTARRAPPGGARAAPGRP